MSICEGDFVTSPAKPEWGLGKVLEILEGLKIRIFFENAAEKLMLSDRVEIAPKPERHFVLDQVDRTRTVKGFRPVPDLEKAFLGLHSGGFLGESYLTNEREYKVKASAYFQEHLGRQALEGLLAAGQFEEVCKIALRVISKTNLIFPQESMALREGLKRGDEQKQQFARALFEQLYGDGTDQQRFEGFAQMLTELDACKWTIATYFPYMNDPAHHIFVKPTITVKAAEAFAFDIAYNAHPNWRTYDRIRQFVAFVSAELSKREILVPQDLIDVQSFIWCSQQ